MGDGRAGRAVTGQYHLFCDAADGRIQGLNPVGAARGLPVLLFKTMVVRMLCAPDALPVLRARVKQTGDDENGCKLSHESIPAFL